MAVLRFLLFFAYTIRNTASVVTGDYQLRARVHSYSNPESKCATCIQSLSNQVYGCCDNHANTGVCTGPERCDTLFRYCLRPLGQIGAGTCSHHILYTVIFLPDTDILRNVGDSVMGSRNPFTLTGISWTGFQFYLESKDSDQNVGGGVQLIDSFAVDLSIQGGQRLEPREYQGRFGIAEIELSFELVCTDNYSLPDCSPCQPGSSEQCKDRRQVPNQQQPSNNSAPVSNAAIVGSVLGVSLILLLLCMAAIALVLVRKRNQGSPHPTREQTNTVEVSMYMRQNEAYLQTPYFREGGSAPSIRTYVNVDCQQNERIEAQTNPAYLVRHTDSLS